MAEPGITSYGRSWEQSHSLWIGWALLSFGFFSWVSFLYAGLRARKRSWSVWAAAYALPWIPLLIIQEDPVGWDAFDFTALSILLVWVVSSVHAFRIRPEYLRRIADRRMAKRGALGSRAGDAARPNPTLRHLQRGLAFLGNIGARTYRPPAGWYADPAGGPGERWWNGGEWTGETRGQTPGRPSVSFHSQSLTRSDSSAIATSAAKPLGQEVPAQPVDLNTAREEELAPLPGIGAVLAKRVVAERHQRGGFRSVEEMAVAVGLKPHILQRLRGRVIVNQAPEIPSPQPRGRVVDF